MIRVNLLPVRAAKRKETIRLQLMASGAITVLVVLISFGIYIKMASMRGDSEEKLRKDKAEQEALKREIGVLEEINKQKAVIMDKLNTVKSLEEAKTGPVELLKAIGEATPDKAWLASLTDEGKSIRLVSYAINENTMSDFMRNLQKNKKMFENVELEGLSRILETETGLEVVSFTLVVTKAAPAPPTK